MTIPLHRVITGLTVAAGATAALYAATATAHADQWTPHYDVDTATLVQSPSRTQLAWAVPASFTDSGGHTLSGIEYIRPSEGGPNAEFVTDSGAVYALDKQFGGLGMPTMYYAPGPGNPAGSLGVIESGSGTVKLSSDLSWLVEPAVYTNAVTAADALGRVDFGNTGVLDLGGAGTSPAGTWTPAYPQMTPVAGKDGLPVWSFDDTEFTGPGGKTLDGTVYLESPLTKVGLYDEEFVTKGGAVYDVSQWSKQIENLYYSAGAGGAAVDILKTPYGDWNLSSMSWLFTPPDYAGVVTATPNALLDDADLSGALNLGGASSDGAAADPGVAALDALAGGL